MHNFLGVSLTKSFPIIAQVLLQEVLLLTLCSKWCKLGSHKQELNKGLFKSSVIHTLIAPRTHLSGRSVESDTQVVICSNTLSVLEHLWILPLSGGFVWVSS